MLTVPPARDEAHADLGQPERRVRGRDDASGEGGQLDPGADARAVDARLDAVREAVTGAARLRRGGPARRVERGAAADLIVLDRPLDDALEVLDPGCVRATIIGGEVVHDAE
jgi:predicted amidohydrolase YtcJ